VEEEEEEEEGEEQAKEDDGSKDKDSDAELVRKLSAMPLDVPVGWERSLTTEIGEGRLEGYLLIEEEIPAVTMLFPLRASSCVFGGFSNDELIALLSTFEAKTVKAGEHLIKFGEPVNRMYVLKKGRCVCLNKVFLNCTHLVLRATETALCVEPTCPRPRGRHGRAHGPHLAAQLLSRTAGLFCSLHLTADVPAGWQGP
jgi:hypothetical protein